MRLLLRFGWCGGLVGHAVAPVRRPRGPELGRSAVQGSAVRTQSEPPSSILDLLLVVRPGAPSSFLFLVAMPGAPSVLAPCALLRGCSGALPTCPGLRPATAVQCAERGQSQVATFQNRRHRTF